jgi:phosphoesterase RecJ-like protein
MLSDAIKNAKTIAIMAHKNPDGDALGGLLALGHICRNEFGKEPVLLHEGVIPDNLRFLASDWWLKKTEDLKDTVFDLCILLDTGAIDNQIQIEGKAIFDNAKYRAKIDHHLNSPEIADVNIIDTTVSATCEIIARMAFENNWKVTSDISRFLYAGIFSDTGGFTHTCTTPTTMRIAAQLMECGVVPQDLVRKFSEKAKETLMNNAETLARSLFSDDNKIGFTTFSVKKEKDSDRPHRETSWLHAQILAAKEIEISVIFKEPDNDEGKIHVSMRSKNMPINTFAEQFGGGGHALAAAFSFPGTMAEAVVSIIPKLNKFINAGQ